VLAAEIGGEESSFLPFDTEKSGRGASGTGKKKEAHCSFQEKNRKRKAVKIEVEA